MVLMAEEYGSDGADVCVGGSSGVLKECRPRVCVYDIVVMVFGASRLPLLGQRKNNNGPTRAHLPQKAHLETSIGLHLLSRECILAWSTPE